MQQMSHLILIILKQINENELDFRSLYYNAAVTNYKKGKKRLPLKVAFPLINKNTLQIAPSS